jgi:adenylate kinase
MSAAPPRQSPNILVTGTPGTGKTTTCELIASATGLRHLNVGEMVKAQELHSGWDEEFQCYIIDEDKVGRLDTT